MLAASIVGSNNRMQCLYRNQALLCVWAPGFPLSHYQRRLDLSSKQSNDKNFNGTVNISM